MKLLRGAVAIVAILATSLAWAGKNQSPTVSLTSPAKGATLSAPAIIALSASASDADGTVTQVQFFQGITLLGTDTSAPYTFSWTSVTAGSYSLTAKATDNGGAVTTSTAVPVTVTAPVAPIIASPADGASIYASSVTVSGTYSGDRYTTTVLADNGNSSVVATLNGNNYSATLPLFRGSNTLTIHVDRMDKTYDTATITVTGNDPPFVALASPTGDAFTAPASLNVVATALSASGSISKVVLTANGMTLATLTSPPYQFTWSNLPAGTYTLAATATDNGGVTATAAKVLSVTAANQLPSVGIMQPANGSYFFAPANVTMAAIASDPDGAVSVVQFFANGAQVGASYVAPHIFNWTNVPAGMYTITAQATDNRSGQTTSSPITVTVYPSDVPPTVSLTAPVSGQILSAPATVTLSASAADSDGSIAKLDFYRGSALLGTVTSPPYTLTWPNVPFGRYTLSAVATDNQAAYTASTPVTITVDAAPTVSLTSPVNGEVFTAPADVSLRANAADSDGAVAKVEFYQGATRIGTAASSPYVLSWHDVAAGNYSLTAVVTDDAGLTTTSPPAPISVRTPNQAPSATLTSPASGAAFWTPGDVTLTSSAADSDGTVSKVEFFDGETLLGTADSPPYSFAWTNPAVGTHSLTAVATDDGAATGRSTPITVTVKPMQLTLLAPAAEASVSGNHVLVYGLVQAPFNSGVVINGEVAMIDDDDTRFWADVVVSAGANIVEATLTTQDGRRVSQSITIYSDGSTPFLEIVPTQLEVVSPSPETFTLTNHSATTASVQYNGDSPFTIPASETRTFEINYGAPHSFQIRFSATDESGNATTQIYMAVPHNPVDLDQNFTALWNDMNSRLIRKDKVHALTFLSLPAQETFGPVFDALISRYAQIAASFSALQRSSLTTSTGEYVVKRSVNYKNVVFFIYFVKGGDGIWRLDSM